MCWRPLSGDCVKQFRCAHVGRRCRHFLVSIVICPGTPQAEPVATGPMSIIGSTIVRGPMKMKGSLSVARNILVRGPITATRLAQPHRDGMIRLTTLRNRTKRKNGILLHEERRQTAPHRSPNTFVSNVACLHPLTHSSRTVLKLKNPPTEARWPK